MKKRNFTFLKSAAVFGLLILFMSAPLFAQQTPERHTVQPGETLFSIARDFNITVGDLRRWNDLESDNLNPGQILRIAPPASDNQVIHAVEPGETLFSISRRYGVTIAEIQQWNNLTDNSLETGRELIIFTPDEGNTGESLPPVGNMDETVLPEDRESIVRVTDISPANTYYTVKSGDTLYKIAADHGMTIAELRTINNLEGDLLRVGQQLTVRETESSAPSVEENVDGSTPQGRFVQYRIERGENGADLLRKFQMSEPELLALNPGVELNQLSAGQRVTVLLPPNRTFSNPFRQGAALQNLGKVPVFSYSTGSSALPTTSGELYNPEQLTAAHANMSLGNVVYIENTDNGRGLFVRINDRHSGEGLKLSAKAFEMLEFKSIDRPQVTIYLENQ